MAFNVKASYETDTLSLKKGKIKYDQHRKGYVIDIIKPALAQPF
jgi:hypothetical protein